MVLVILAFNYWRSGGQMFSPGPLSAVHADIPECADCHQPLISLQAPLCMDCHTGIRDELESGAGLHARLTTPENCLVCHPDHRGPDFDPLAHAVSGFDHSLSFFSLVHHELDFDSTPIECADCHEPGNFESNPPACLSCHENADAASMQAHLADFGADCMACHDGADRMTDFNHAATLFPLEGEHQEVACVECHIEGQFEGTVLACAACHAEPAIHTGLFQSACEDCHNPSGWTPALFNGSSFDHFTTSGFSLAKHATHYDGSLLNCKSCHVDDLQTFSPQVCEACHTAADPLFMAQHVAEFGLSCLDCHDGLDSIENFAHSSVFVLDGAHAELACASCHVDHNFATTPNTCSGCHAEPEIHAGVFGLQCENCHTTGAWQPAVMTSHSFPLNHGGQGEIACATCHPANFVQFTCDECHAPVEMTQEHNKEDIFDIAGRCLECHPTGLKEEGGEDD